MIINCIQNRSNPEVEFFPSEKFEKIVEEEVKELNLESWPMYAHRNAAAQKVVKGVWKCNRLRFYGGNINDGFIFHQISEPTIDNFERLWTKLPHCPHGNGYYDKKDGKVVYYGEKGGISMMNSDGVFCEGVEVTGIREKMMILKIKNDV